MKTVFLFIFVTAFANAQFIYFPDPNLKSRLLGIGVASLQAQNPGAMTSSADANQDGEISYGEAHAVYGLNLSPAGNEPTIHSIEGLQHFSNLKTLIVRNNSIGNISQAPPSVHVLDASSNQIASVNLQQLPQLRKLLLSQNPLQALDLDELTHLGELTIRSTAITELDCRTTRIVRLDCSQNPNLSYINIQNGYRWSSSTKSACPLNFDNLPALTQVCIDPLEIHDLNCSRFNPVKVSVYDQPHCSQNRPAISSRK